MHASSGKANTSSDEAEESVEARADSRQKTATRRRLADSINPRGRKLKLDRRVEQIDRRTDTASEYKGPARRKTIDQRENTRDRRNKG